MPDFLHYVAGPACELARPFVCLLYLLACTRSLSSVCCVVVVVSRLLAWCLTLLARSLAHISYFARAFTRPLTRMLFRLPLCLNYMPSLASTAARNHTGIESTAVVLFPPGVHRIFVRVLAASMSSNCASLVESVACPEPVTAAVVDITSLL